MNVLIMLILKMRKDCSIKNINITIIILFITDGKPVTWEKSFLQNVAKQNFAQYNVQQRSSEPIVVSEMLV